MNAPDPEEVHTAATMRDFRAAWRELGLTSFLPAPDVESLIECARDDAEYRALRSLGTIRRKAINRLLHHLASGVDMAQAKQLAARDCKTKVGAIDELFSDLKKAEPGDL